MPADADDNASVPPVFLAALALAATYMAFTAYDQSYWWRNQQDYSFGWLVPVFAAYVIHARWREIRRHVVAPGSLERHPASKLWRLLSLAAPVLFVVAHAIFLLGAFYRGVAGTTHLSSLAITGGMTGVVLMTMFLIAPVPAAAPEEKARQRWKLASLFLFPSLVWIVSAPLLTSIDHNLALYLMRQVTTIVFFVFDRLGLTLEQHGNVLMLPSGSVGVEEACSGVRSLTGCLFAGTFLGAVFVRSAWRKWVLIVASLVFAFVANLLRSLFLTSWAYYHGAKSIEGTIHDATGYAVLGIAVIALLGMLPLIDRPTNLGRGTKD